MPTADARRIASRVLEALHYMHEHEVVHRDLKPENIMILAGTNDEGQPTDVVKVCDFGIAKMTERRDEKLSQGAGPLTAQGLVIGTPEYMSPEQGKGDSLDLRSDIYSIGVIIFQLLTRRLPFEAETALGIVFKQVTEEPARPSSINPAVDPHLEAVCLKAMRKRREDRYQSAREMRAELRSVLGGSAPVVAAPSGRGGALPEALDADAELLVRSTGAAVLSAPEDTDLRSKTTAGATTFLDERARPRTLSFVLVGLAIAALSAVVAVVLVLHTKGSPGADVGSPARATSENASAAANTEDAHSVLATSGPSDAELPVDDPRPSPVPSVATLTHAPRPSRATSAVVRAQPSPAATAIGGNSFDLTTASAHSSVVHADGASLADVRAALPTSQFIQCYRDALKRVGRRLEGKMSVHVQLGTDGHVTSALVSAPESLAQGIGGCVTQTFNRLPIANVAAGGGAADINIVFVPE
jgi:serine/threonine-protein kinase